MARSGLVTILPGCAEDDITVVVLAWIQAMCWRMFTDDMIGSEIRKIARREVRQG